MDASHDGTTVKRHHWIVRATHWVNVVALAVMVGSGLRIFNAYPMFARKGETFCCWPWEGHEIPAWLTFGKWLAGARNWHFAMMWVLAVNGAVYLAFIWLHGEWRDLAPRRGDIRDAWEMVKFYLFVRKRHPHQGKHNALQKSVYFVLPWLGVLAVLTGLAIWKPVQLAPLTGLFGGYVWARYWHFLVMMSLVLLGLVHVVMVFAVDPQSLRSMITGRYDESRSPEALNARPFFRSQPKPVLSLSRSSTPVAPSGDRRTEDSPPVSAAAPSDRRPASSNASSTSSTIDPSPSSPSTSHAVDPSPSSPSTQPDPPSIDPRSADPPPAAQPTEARAAERSTQRGIPGEPGLDGGDDEGNPKRGTEGGR